MIKRYIKTHLIYLKKEKTIFFIQKSEEKPQ